MKASSLLLMSVFLIGGAASAHANECSFDRTLTVQGNGFLDAATGSGNLKVVAGGSGQVHISGHAKSSHWMGGNDGDVQRICNEPPIEQNGSDIKIGHEHNDWFRHVNVDYTIEVPPSFNVRASSGSGNVELHDLAGEVNGNTGSGDVRASNLKAGAKLETGSGNIEASEINGAASMETGSGDIKARLDGNGDVRAHTGSGNVHLDGVAGGLDAETGSGNIDIDGKPVSRWKLNTGSGNVTLRLPEGSGFDLDAESSSGNINTHHEIAMEGNLNKHHVRGRVGGGGPEIHAETGSGDITID